MGRQQIRSFPEGAMILCALNTRPAGPGNQYVRAQRIFAGGGDGRGLDG
jgi:hypothetical protein